MALFESTLILVLVAVFLLQIAHSLAIPYPALLALAGVLVAALPGTPDVTIDPQLAMALFIAPALLNAAFEFPPRMFRRFWRPLLALAGIAVLLTTAAVAWVGVALGGLPLAAAIALGAIVAPPDAVAAAAMLSRLDLPRRTVRVLEGESLLNDAVALLIFAAAVRAASAGSLGAVVPELALAAPGGIVLGIVMGRIKVLLYPRMIGTLRGTLFEFAATFAAWILAERLHLSPILSVVAFSMTVARYMPAVQTPRDRVLSYAVWDAVGFLLNVLAFLLLGLQARQIVQRLAPDEMWSAFGFALAVLATVIGVRLVWVLIYNRLMHALERWKGAPLGGGQPTPGLAVGLAVSWCGMRGLVTLATALGLPAAFPGRDLIVLSALTVVLGTLVVQGVTLGPLIRLLRFPPDDSFDQELASTRVALLDAAIDTLDRRQDGPARQLHDMYVGERSVAQQGDNPRGVTEDDHLRRRTLIAKRRTLLALRRRGEIDDDVFHALQQELDWAELAASHPDRFEIIEG